MNIKKSTLVPALIGLSCVVAHLMPADSAAAHFLTTWGGGVTTKPITALCFIFACLHSAVHEGGDARHNKEIGITIILTLLVGFIGGDTPTDEPLTVGRNVPSLGTGAMFIAIATACLCPNLQRWCGTVVLGLCVLAAGHVFNIPELYYYIDGLSTAMARPTLTAGLFIGCGMVKRGCRGES